MPQFDLASFSSQLFWLAVVFGFLYFLVNKFIAPKAESILTARNRCLEENIKSAEQYNEKVKSLEVFKEDKLSEVNAHVEEVNQQALAFLDLHFADKQSELSAILGKKRAKALAEIESYVEKFHTDKPEFCLRLAAFIIERVTNKKADINILKEIQGKTQ